MAFSFHRAMDHAGAVAGAAMSALLLWAFLGYALWHGGHEKPSADEMSALRWVFALALIPGLLAMVTLGWKVKEVASQTAKKAPAAGGRLPGRFYGFLGVVTLFTLGNSSDLFLVLYGKTMFGLSLLSVIGLWVMLHLSKIIFSIPGGVLSDRWGRRGVLVAGWTVYAGVYVGMAFVRATWLFWLLIFLYGAYYGLSEGAEKALVADFAPAESRGKAFGMYHAAVGLAALPASFVFGVFWAQLGPAAAFGIGAGLAVAALALLVVLLSAGPGKQAA